MRILDNMLDDKALDSLPREELLQLLELTEKWQTNEDIPFFLYKPNPVMYSFHKSIAKCRTLMGGNRSGKTEANTVDMAAQFTGKCPRSLEGIIPTYRLDQHRRNRLNVIDYPNAFEKISWPKLQKHIHADDICDVVKEQGRIKAITNFKGGFLEFMQYEQDVKKFQGTSRHAMFYDEEPPQAIRDENLMRLVDTDGEETFSMTPISEENSAGYQPTLWIYDEIFLKAGIITEREDGEIRDKVNPLGDPNTHVFFANIWDNQALSHTAIERILSKFSPEERMAREKGYFMFLAGLIYKNYSDATHVIPSFNDWWEGPHAYDYTLYMAIDPHPRVPHAIMFMVVDRNQTKYVVDELFVAFKNVDDFASATIAKCNGRIPEVVLIDPSAFVNDPSDGSCFAWDLLDAFGMQNFPMPPFLHGSKDLSRGIIQTRAALDLGLNGKPSLFITDNCARTRFEMTHYRWQSWSKNAAPAREVKQKPVDKDDHMMEDLRRLVTFNPQFVSGSAAQEEYDNIVRKPTGGVGKNKYTGY